MPEFQRRWRDWGAENLPRGLRDGTDKTDESPFGSFGRPIEAPAPENSDSREPAPPPENLPEEARDRTDKTDESPDVSAGPVEQPPSGHTPQESATALGACHVDGCRFTGYNVELGDGLSTRLCAAHRRVLFRRAREIADPDDEETAKLFGQRPCRACGRLVEPEDDPCKPCAAVRSPLVRLAISLGARPVCACGAEVPQPGDCCERCLGGDVS